MRDDLLGLYREILDLTFRQRLAIKKGHWAELSTLADERGKLLAEASVAPRAPGQGDGADVRAVLEQIAMHSATNMRLLGARREEILHAMRGFVRGKQALSVYQSALAGYPTAVAGRTSRASAIDQAG